MDNPQASPAPPNPWLPDGSPDPLAMETFEGVDTASSRYGVDPKQCYWIDGWLPIGRSRLRTLFDVGPAIYTVPTGKTIVCYYFVNIAGNPIAVIFLNDGSIVQLRTDTFAVTQMAGPGTIQDPQIANVAVAQWGNQYVIIVANQTNGYWLWDGKLFYAAGGVGPVVNITSVGSGYTFPPTITPYGGSGSGASFAATVNTIGQVTSISVVSTGTGYIATDAVGLQISGGGNPGRTAILQPIITNGTISSVSVVDGGLGYQGFKDTKPSAILTFVGGDGAGAQASVAGVSGGSITTVVVTNGGSGYLFPTTIFVTDPNNTIAQANATMMPFGTQGNGVETFSGHVWVIDGPVYQFTAPGSVVDFAAADGGGTVTATDACLRTGFTKIIQTNGFLYLFADSSLFYISGVNTNTTTPGNIVTSFSYQNADPENGTNWPASVVTFDRSLAFANPFGIHLSKGAAAEKASMPLDGVYTTVPNFNGLSISAGKATVFSKKLLVVLVPIIDPVSKQQQNKLLIFDGKRWFSSTQSINFIFIQGQEVNSILTCYGTDGQSIYPMFQTPSNSFTKTVQSKFWGVPGGYQFVKTTGRIWALFDEQLSASASVSASIDSEITQSFVPLVVPTNSGINTVNASGTIIPVKNSTPITIPVNSIFGGHWVTQPQAMGQQGALVGMTLQTTISDITLISVMSQQEIQAYRG